MAFVRIVELESAPIHEIPHLSAAKRGGSEARRLPVLLGHVSGLPTGCGGMVLTSDLQGMAPSWGGGGASVLLGEVVVEQLEQLAEEDHIPPLSSMGAILAGDFFSAPEANKRGASGEVLAVWMAFARSFQWVAGVAGNHDDLGTPREVQRLRHTPGVALLDGELAGMQGLQIGGVSLITGPAEKRGRREPDDQLRRIAATLRAGPDVLILHEGPLASPTQRGNPDIAQLIQSEGAPLTVCGHTHWEDPLATLGRAQVLNVDGRVVVLASDTS